MLTFLILYGAATVATYTGLMVKINLDLDNIDKEQK